MMDPLVLLAFVPAALALNLTPEYFEADRQYRAARTPDEKLAALELMLRAIPKHKSSEKKQADLKRRISELKAHMPVALNLQKRAVQQGRRPECD